MAIKQKASSVPTASKTFSRDKWFEIAPADDKSPAALLDPLGPLALGTVGLSDLCTVPLHSLQLTSSAVPTASPIPLVPNTADRAPESLHTLTSIVPPN